MEHQESMALAVVADQDGPQAETVELMLVKVAMETTAQLEQLQEQQILVVAVEGHLTQEVELLQVDQAM
jgi:hypothetical protein